MKRNTLPGISREHRAVSCYVTEDSIHAGKITCGLGWLKPVYIFAIFVIQFVFPFSYKFCLCVLNYH